MIQKSVKATLFNDSQENEKSKIQENANNKNKINEKEENEKIEKTKSSYNEKNEYIKNLDNFSINILIEPTKKIINFKKYNYLNDPYSNYNTLSKNYENRTPKKRLRESYPFIKVSNSKYLKKENIDKKIFRKFRKFAKAYYNDNKNSSIFKKNGIFWKKFNSNNILPPMKISNNGNEIEFKSFSSQYFIWLFDQEGITELFKIFVEKEKVPIINNFISEYKLDNSNDSNIIEKIKQYLNYIPKVYSQAGKTNLEEDKLILKEKIINEKNEEKESYLANINNPINTSKKINFIESKNFKELPLDNDDNIF